jgi:hypothetical protein
MKIKQWFQSNEIDYIVNALFALEKFIFKKYSKSLGYIEGLFLLTT